jgi:hypothetical protein
MKPEPVISARASFHGRYRLPDDADRLIEEAQPARSRSRAAAA